MLVALLVFGLYVWIVLALENNPFAFNNEYEPLEKKSKPMYTSSNEWNLYTSNRFNVTGNAGWKINILDLHDNMEYTIQFSDLIQFRARWARITPNNRDIYLLSLIANRTGKPVIKKVA